MNTHVNAYSIKADQVTSSEYLETLANRILLSQEILIEETAEVLNKIAHYVRRLEASRLPTSASPATDDL